MSKPRPVEAEVEAALLDRYSYDPESGLFRHRVDKRNGCKAGFVAGRGDKRGYLLLSVKTSGKERNIKAHRAAWFFTHGRWPADQLDHVNRDKADNRIANLREVSCRQNQHNKAKQSPYGVGVSNCPKECPSRPYRAHIKAYGKGVFLGYFPTAEEAAEEYRRAAERISQGLPPR